MGYNNYFHTTLLALLVLLFSAGSVCALTVKNVRFGIHPDKTRMVLELSETSDFRTFILSDPYRIVVDLPKFTWEVGNITKPVGSGVSAIRQGILKKEISRIVVDISKPMTIKSAFLLPATKDEPARLVVDFTSSTRGNFISARGNIHGTLSTPKTAGANVTTSHVKSSSALSVAKPQRKPRPSVPYKKPLIIIDPGHGGADSGASSSAGIAEEHVVLAMAKELKKYLEKTGRYKVKLTRTGDKYMRLYKRVDLARKSGGDLFISLHADSIDNPRVRGASVYTLSDRASDAQTARLAARENRADIIGGIDLSVEDEDVADILIDLAMRDTMNQSNFFANIVVSKLKKADIRVLEKPHRSAGFAVLKAPDIPSVLIETGFMSNNKEAKLLSTVSYRKQIAGALIASIDSYFAKIRYNNGT